MKYCRPEKPILRGYVNLTLKKPVNENQANIRRYFDKEN